MESESWSHHTSNLTTLDLLITWINKSSLILKPIYVIHYLHKKKKHWILKVGVKLRCGYAFTINHKAVFLCYIKHVIGRDFFEYIKNWGDFRLVLHIITLHGMLLLLPDNQLLIIRAYIFKNIGIYSINNELLMIWNKLKIIIWRGV